MYMCRSFLVLFPIAFKIDTCCNTVGTYIIRVVLYPVHVIRTFMVLKQPAAPLLLCNIMLTNHILSPLCRAFALKLALKLITLYNKGCSPVSVPLSVFVCLCTGESCHYWMCGRTPYSCLSGINTSSTNNMNLLLSSSMKKLSG